MCALEEEEEQCSCLVFGVIGLYPISSEGHLAPLLLSAPNMPTACIWREESNIISVLRMFSTPFCWFSWSFIETLLLNRENTETEALCLPHLPSSAADCETWDPSVSSSVQQRGWANRPFCMLGEDGDCLFLSSFYLAVAIILLTSFSFLLNNLGQLSS